MVALAAQQLKLPTISPQVLKIAADEYETRIAASHKAFRISCENDMRRVFSSRRLQYPVIIKPCTRWSSEGVSRATDGAEAKSAAQFDRHKGYVINEYCEGPEVDANLFLLGVELLFWEILDELPKSGDIGSAWKSNFDNNIEVTGCRAGTTRVSSTSIEFFVDITRVRKQS